MRPYLAVIKDSFREAFATRVLWIVLILIAIFLGLIAPFGYEKTVAIALQFSDVKDAGAFLSHLQDKRDNADSPAGYVWSRLSEDLQDQLTNLKKDSPRHERMRAQGRLRDEVNEMFSDREFLDSEVWASIRLGAEGAELRQKAESLGDEQHARLSRLTFDAAFRDFIEPAGREALQFGYLWYPLGDEVPLTEDQLQMYGKQIVAFLVSRLVGNIGVFIALLVTASIVPQMLDAGAIDLLLSKPVNRPFLFLSKFAGGCVFILLNAAFLVVGLWLVLGIRLNLWSDGLLWTIPVFVFVFAIYYSVSTLAAVIWRNAVVSIVVSILFWSVCFVVGFSKARLDEWFLDARRSAEIIPAGESLIVTNRQGSGFEWNAEESSWNEVFRQQRRGPGPRSYPFIGPVFDSSGERLVAIRSGGNRWMRSSPKLAVASQDNDWKPKDSISVPGGTKTISVTETGDILVAGTDGVHRFEGDAEAEEGGFNLFGMKVPGFGQDAQFKRVDDKAFDFRKPFAAAFNSQSDELAVRSGESLAVLARNGDGEFAVRKTVEFTESAQALIGHARSRILIARQDGTVLVFSAESLEKIGEHSPFGQNEPRLIRCSSDGRWVAVLFHHRHLWLYDTQSDQACEETVTGQGDVSSVAFGVEGTLYVSTGFGRVTKYESPESMRQTELFAQEPDFLESLYSWVIDPVYSVFPKPGDMENVVTWLMTEQQTVTTDDDDELSAERVVIDIWEPIYSNLAFLVVVLSLTSLYISRKDF